MSKCRKANLEAFAGTMLLGALQDLNGRERKKQLLTVLKWRSGMKRPKKKRPGAGQTWRPWWGDGDREGCKVQGFIAHVQAAMPRSWSCRNSSTQKWWWCIIHATQEAFKEEGSADCSLVMACWVMSS